MTLVLIDLMIKTIAKAARKIPIRIHLTNWNLDADSGLEEKLASINPLIFQKSPAPTTDAKSATERSMMRSNIRSAKIVPKDLEKGTPSER
ncbi:hypothetical protein D3C86_1961870 [compost metagenome]